MPGRVGTANTWIGHRSEALGRRCSPPHRFSTVVFRLTDPATFDRVAELVDTDVRLSLQAKREVRFCAEQSEQAQQALKLHQDRLWADAAALLLTWSQSVKIGPSPT